MRIRVSIIFAAGGIVMQVHSIPFSQTRSFSKIVVDYLDDAEALRPFYAWRPEIPAFAEAIKDLHTRNFNRPLLVETLKRQYSAAGLLVPKLQTSNLKPQTTNLQPPTSNLQPPTSNPLSPTANIELLSSPNTFTVTTGHQLCLFTGPLYFIYKIVSAINLAKKLKQAYPAYDFVPVYWMASEDHDFDEIRRINLFGKTVEWKEAMTGPAGRMATVTLAPVLDEVASIMGDGAWATALNDLFRRAYAKEAGLAAATRILVHELFGGDGLVVLDAADAGLKKPFAAIMLNDALTGTPEKLVGETSRRLEEAGYKTQVNARPVNSFYMKEATRERIVGPAESGKRDVFAAGAVVFDGPSLRREMSDHPERFSPNVVLRPLFQQAILPNIAYVGGGAEVAYWLQYKDLFTHYGIFYPVLALRDSALWVDKVSSGRMAKLGLSPAHLFSEEESLVKAFVLEHSEEDIVLSEEKERMLELFDGLVAKAAAVDASLKQAVLAEAQKCMNVLDGLQARLQKAQKRNFETQTAQIRALKGKFFPGGALQERHDNFIPLYLRHGKAFLDELRKTFDPLEGTVKVFVEDMERG